MGLSVSLCEHIEAWTLLISPCCLMREDVDIYYLGWSRGMFADMPVCWLIQTRQRIYSGASADPLLCCCSSVYVLLSQTHFLGGGKEISCHLLHILQYWSSFACSLACSAGSGS